MLKKSTTTISSTVRPACFFTDANYTCQYCAAAVHTESTRMLLAPKSLGRQRRAHLAGANSIYSHARRARTHAVLIRSARRGCCSLAADAHTEDTVCKHKHTQSAAHASCCRRQSHNAFEEHACSRCLSRTLSARARSNTLLQHAEQESLYLPLLQQTNNTEGGVWPYHPLRKKAS